MSLSPLSAVAHTKAVYQFERCLLAYLSSRRGAKWRSMRKLASNRFGWEEMKAGELADFIVKLWQLEHTRRQMMPTIEFRRHGETAAYSLSRIVLVRDCCSLIILVHEFVHCLGFGNPHGECFAGKYLAMLTRHLGIPENFLIPFALTYGLRFKRPKSDVAIELEARRRNLPATFFDMPY